MRTATEDLTVHLSLPTTTLALLWKLKLEDGTLMGFTSHVRRITYDDGSGDGPIVYKATTAVTPSEATATLGTEVNSMVILGIVSDQDIRPEDLANGVYDHALAKLMVVNYKDLSMGDINYQEGYLGEITISANEFRSESRSLMQQLLQRVGKTCTPQCPWAFCGPECTLSEAAYTTAGVVVTRIIDRKVIYASGLSGFAANYFNDGKVTFMSGDNAMRLGRIKTFDHIGGDGRIELFDELPYLPSAGDDFDIMRGCNKLFTTCQGYSNEYHFGGFPHVPGNDAVLRTIPS